VVVTPPGLTPHYAALIRGAQRLHAELMKILVVARHEGEVIHVKSFQPRG
jgi:hypothetical protein